MINKIIGTPGKITVTEDERGNFVIDIDPTYGGQVSIHTLGTITTGLYRGYPIEDQYGGTGCNNTGVISASGDVTITGSLTLMCNPEMQSVLKVPEVQGTIALQENSLQTQNCFSEFTKEQAKKAFDTISPTYAPGQIIAYDGEKNIAINQGRPYEYLGVDPYCTVPKYLPLPNIYSYITNDYEGKPDYRFCRYQENDKPAGWPYRRILNFSSKCFEVEDNKALERTDIKLHNRLEEIERFTDGLWVMASSDKSSNDNNDKHEFKKRKLNSCDHINITNADFVTGNPCVSLSKRYPGQDSIKTVGAIEKGKWEAEPIKPEFGGTGSRNEGPIVVTSCAIIEVPFMIEGSKTDALIFKVNGIIDLKLCDSGTLATSEKTLQIQNNLQDIANSSEAFRHISPTKKRGDIIARGYGDYDTVIEIGNKGDLLVADPNSDAAASYKHPRDIDTLRDYINQVFEDKLEEAQRDLKKLLKMYQDYDSDLCKRIDSLCSQFDYMARTKQLNLTKELKEELKEWTMEKINSKTSQNT